MSFTNVLSLHRGAKSPLSIYFFLAEHGEIAQHSPYEHTAIALAEGLASLGVPFASNVDYWPPLPGADCLFRHDPAIDPLSCRAVVFTTDWFYENKYVPWRLFEGLNRPVTVYLETIDGSRLPSLESRFPKFDIVLRAHYSAAMPFPARFHPWAFGLSNRIIKACESREPGESRRSRLFVSYRHVWPAHSVRIQTDRSVLKRIASRLPVYRYTDEFKGSASAGSQAEHLWRITGRRHSSRYYAELRQSLACACFGGYFVPSWPRNERNALSLIGKRILTRFRAKSRRITQFDSWRLWESLAAGCATIHLDLEKYGAVMPVMPVNWEHYIGLDLDNLERDLNRLLADPELLERVGAAGRAWSIATYGPRPTAERFLALIGSLAFY